MINKFSMSGQELVELGREKFLDHAPPFMGDILWEHLEILQAGRWRCTSRMINTCSIYLSRPVILLLKVIQQFLL